MQMIKDPGSGLVLPKEFVDEKQALKAEIDKLVDECVLAHQHLDRVYYLTLHMKFDRLNPGEFVISPPVITYKLPPFTTNQMVFWVSNKKGICELLWMVRKGKDNKPIVDFNKQGVAYLKAKGAMPS